MRTPHQSSFRITALRAAPYRESLPCPGSYEPRAKTRVDCTSHDLRLVSAQRASLNPSRRSILIEQWRIVTPGLKKEVTYGFRHISGLRPAPGRHAPGSVQGSL